MLYHSARTPAPVAVTERRHLTMLSCILADAERLAQQLDPEDHLELLVEQPVVEIVRQPVGAPSPILSGMSRPRRAALRLAPGRSTGAAAPLEAAGKSPG